MTYGEPARPATGGIRIRWLRVLGLLIVVVAIGALYGHESWGIAQDSRVARPRGALGEPAGAPVLRSGHRRPLGEADGAIPDGTTVFSSEVPGVARLDPKLLGALRRAADAAEGDGVAFTVDSGWRSRAYQAQLLRQAVSRYGSEAEATRWVATPDTSAHVSGDAIDLGADGAAWLSQHGAGYALCQTYDNEPWHYELRPAATDDGCPPRYADPTHDPRMQR